MNAATPGLLLKLCKAEALRRTDIGTDPITIN